MSICFLLVDLQLKILGLQGANSIDIVRIATQNMSNADFAAALSTTALTEAERLQLIAGRQLTDAELEKALATNTSSAANVGATATTFSLAGAFNSLKTAIKGVGIAMMSNPITAIITVALTAITVISRLKAHVEKAASEIKEKSEDAANAIQEINDTFQKTTKTVDDIGKRFAELAQGVDSLTGKNISLTSDEYAEFLKISNQLAELFPALTRHYDENGNAIVNLSGSVDTIVDSLTNLVNVQRQVANQSIAEKLPDLYAGAIQKSREFKADAEMYQNEIQGSLSAFEGLHGGFINGNMMTIRAPVDSLEELERVEQIYLSVLDDLGIAYQYADNLDGIRYKINSFSNMSASEITTMTSQIESAVKEALLADTSLNKYFDNANRDIEEYAGLVNSSVNKNKSNWAGLTSAIVSWLSTDSTYQTLSDEMQSIVQMMLNNVDFAELNFDSWEEASQYIIDSIIVPISEASDEVQQAYIDLFSLDSNLSYSTYMANAQKAISAIASGLGKSYEEIAKAVGYDNTLDDLQKKRDKVLNSLFSYGEIRFGEASNLVDSLSASQINSAYSYLTKYGVTTWAELQSAFANHTYDTLIDLKAETESLKNFNTAISESASATGLSAESLTNLNGRYKEVEGHEVALDNLYTKTSLGIRVNIKSVRELEKAYNNQKKEKQIKQLESLKAKYKDLTTAMRNTTDATKYAELYNQRSNIAQQIDDASKLASQYQALASSYNAWQAAMSSDNPSDPYANIQSGYEKIGKLIEQGWQHKDEVDTYLDLLLNPEIRTTNNEADYERLVQEIKNTGFSIKDFFVTDDDGNLVTDGIYNFFDAINKGLGSDYVKVLSDGSYWWDLTGNKTEEVAKYLGVSVEFVDWMQQAMSDITGDITFEGMFEDFTLDAKDAEETLISLTNKFREAKEQYHLDEIYLNTDDLKEANQYIENLGNLIKDKFIGKDGTIDFTISGAEEAAIVMSALIQQKAKLTAPVVMSIDIDALEGVDTQMSTALSLLQQFIQLSTQLETQQTLGLDTSNTQTQLVNVSNSLNGLPKEIKTKIGINSDDVNKSLTSISNAKVNAGVQLKDGDIDKVKAAIAGIDTKTIELLTNSDSTVSDLNSVEEFTIHDKSFMIKMNGYAHAMDNLKNLDNYQFTPKTITVTTVHAGEGGGKAQGTANTAGTAFAVGTFRRYGDWRTKQSGVALGGEVAPELLVRDGRYYIIGADGTEFFRYEKDDIIFNGEQTRQILQNGKITNGIKRGVVYASGTAFYGGSKGTAPGRRKVTIEAEVAEAAAEEIADSIPDTDSNSPEDSFKYIDRVEILIDRIQRKIQTLSTSIKDIFSLWSDRGDGITKQIRNITEEIDIQKGAAQRYLEEARKQIDKYDLDPEWVKSLETGNLGFIYLTNLDELDEGYREYLKWFEKYLDSRDSIVGLEQDLSQLYKDQFDNIKKNYENQINLSEYLRDSEEKTYAQSTTYFEDMRGIYSKNLELLTNEAKDLEEQLRKAVDDGAIEVGSEAWQEMKKEINGVTKEISKTNVELAKLYTEQFDYIQNNYKNQISSYESLNDANEKNFAATTNYYEEMRDISNKTLKSQREELAALEKEFDEAMDSGRIEKGSEAWYKMRSAIDDTKRSISQTRVELRQLYLDEFNYIQDGFKNQLSLYEYFSSAYQKKATLAETQGYMASSKALAAQREVQLKNTNILREELSALEKEFAEAISKEEIDEYSDAWYSMQNAIDATREALYDSRIEAEKLNQTMRELSWQRFDFRQSMTGQLNDEADFLINMMSFTDLYDKKGRLTDTGLATMGLRNMRADVYNRQAKEYLQAIDFVNEDLREDPENIELINHKQELLKLSRETAIAMENEQKAIVSMVEDGIKLELDSLKELIDTYKEALDSTKDLYDYQNSIADKSKKISDIQKQLSAYANDSSEETRATVQKLQVDLSEAQKDLRDTEYTRSIADQKELLDSLYTEYESFLNTRLDDTNRLLEDMRAVTNTIPDRIGEVLRETSLSVSTQISEDMNNVWNVAAAELQKWNENAEAQQQINRDTLNAADASWGSFGENLRDSVIGQYSDIKTAVDTNAHGIEKVFNDLENKGGQIIANADKNADNIIDEIYKRDNTTTVQNGFTTTNDTLKTISDTAKRIEKKAEEAAAPYMGDVNLDDYVTSSDALTIQRAAIDLEKLSDGQKKLADLNGDGVITSADALAALRIGVGLEKKVKAKSYSTGGLIDYTGEANVHGSKSQPELVLNAQDTRNFIKLNNILRDVMKNQSGDLLSRLYGVDSPVLRLVEIPNAFSGINKPELTQNTTINLGGIAIDHVEDYNDFVNQLKTDSKFEKMIRSMTTGELNGGRSIDKYKYRW